MTLCVFPPSSYFVILTKTPTFDEYPSLSSQKRHILRSNGDFRGYLLKKGTF